jgi:hypothetical protein
MFADSPTSGLNASQLSALSFQAGAFAGAGTAGLSAMSMDASGVVVFLSLLLGFCAGSALGWAGARPVVRIICPRLASRRSQTMLVSATACTVVAALVIVGFIHFSGEHFPLLQPLVGVSTVALFFGVQGKAP